MGEISALLQNKLFWVFGVNGCISKNNPPPQRAVPNANYPTFEVLSDQDLLPSHLHGNTQNQNDTMDALTWQHATKETHSGLAVVELSTFSAVAHFNNGIISIV